MNINLLKNNRFIKNLSWILIGNIFHAICAFILNLYAARNFLVSEYGVINYAASLVTFASSICGLGINQIIAKSFADDEKNSGSYIGTGALLQCIAGVGGILVLSLVVLTPDNNQNNIGIIVLIQSSSLLFSGLSIFIYWYRYCYKANLVAIARMISFAVSALLKVLSMLVFKSIVIFTIGAAIESVALGSILGAHYVREHGWNLKFSFGAAQSILKASYPFIISAALISIYSQTDKIMLQHFIDESAVAFYSASYTIANVVCIIPAALIEAFRPDIMKYKNSNESLYEHRVKQLYGIVFWICISYGIFIAIFKKPIINILYGPNYYDAISSLNWIVWYSSFSYFGAVTNLYLIAENKSRWVQYLTIIGAVLNILLNWALIPRFGIAGAAIASLFTQIISNVIAPCCISEIRPTIVFMFKGISLKYLFRSVYKTRS